MKATFENTENGNIVELNDKKYVVIGKRDLVVLGTWPSMQNVRAFEPEEFDLMNFVKVE